ncbi:uncharacterized protein LOC105702445 [Orussus abietinus]|uniref:uncharacterized protein LOC105702445 n=1 Tax=Orussus abietinus TaxID=222816 RepID=UPI000626C2F0|nr:uncharacterized protein LOC105702445 [Orussus abietinus]
MDESEDLNTEDTLDLASKTWSRSADSAFKAGYREGIAKGEESIFQDSFDQGYKDGFQTTFALGKYKSLAFVLPKDHVCPKEVEAVLNNIKRGACYICTEQDKTSGSNVNEKSFSECQKNQKDHAEKIIQMLHEYYETVMRKHGVDLNELDLNW